MTSTPFSGAPPETIATRIGELSFTHDSPDGYPTEETVDKLDDERDFQRACRDYLWALPIVSFGAVEHVLVQAIVASSSTARIATDPPHGPISRPTTSGPSRCSTTAASA